MPRVVRRAGVTSLAFAVSAIYSALYLWRRNPANDAFAVAAAEVGVGLGLVLLVYRNRRSISLDELSEMKG